MIDFQHKQNFCVDCRFHVEEMIPAGDIDGRPSAWHSCCHHPNNGKNLVTGEQIILSCAQARQDEPKCGNRGDWFEPKEGNAGAEFS